MNSSSFIFPSLLISANLIISLTSSFVSLFPILVTKNLNSSIETLPSLSLSSALNAS